LQTFLGLLATKGITVRDGRGNFSLPKKPPNKATALKPKSIEMTLLIQTIKIWKKSYHGNRVAVIASAAKQSIAQRRACRAALLVVYLVLHTIPRWIASSLRFSQ